MRIQVITFIALIAILAIANVSARKSNRLPSNSLRAKGFNSRIARKSSVPAVSDAFLKQIENSVKKSLNYLDSATGKMSVDSTFCLTAAADLLGDTELGRLSKSIASKDTHFQETVHTKDFNKFKRLVDGFPSWNTKNEVQEHIHMWNQAVTIESNLDADISGNRKNVMIDALKDFEKEGKCNFDESVSDECLQEAMDCKMSEKCLQFNSLKKIKSGYCLTHQMLYYEFLRRYCPRGKATEISFAKEAIKLLTHQLLVETNDKNVKHNDLWSDEWVERYTLGVMVGAYQFIQEDMIRYMIDQQTKAGCWKGDDTVTYGNYLKSKRGSDDDMLDYESGDECSHHTTGLVLYYFSAALKYYKRK